MAKSRIFLFPRTLLLALTLLLGLAAGLYFTLTSYDEKDRKAYHKLIDPHGDELLSSSSQHRTGIQRNFTLSTHHPIAISLQIDESELIAKKPAKNAHVVFVEEMKELKGQIDEEGIHWDFHANRAIYYYQERRLQAHFLDFTCSKGWSGFIENATLFEYRKKWSLTGDTFLGYVEGEKELKISSDYLEGNQREVLLLGHVALEGKEGLRSFSDCARYMYGEGGKILLYGATKERLCHVTLKAANEVEATTVELSSTEQQVIFNEASGIWQGKIHFSGKKGIWNGTSETLALLGSVVIMDPSIGILENPHEILFSLKEGVLKEMSAVGETRLNLVRGGELHCFGRVKVNLETEQVRLLSPTRLDGEVVDGKQVLFTDPHGEIYADKVWVEYDRTKGEISRIVLKGDLRMILDQGEKKQYLLADNGELFLAKQEMILRGSKEERVLLFDPTNNLQISAPALKLIRDAVTEKNSIEGIGDIRFYFLDAELNQFFNRFKKR